MGVYNDFVRPGCKVDVKASPTFLSSGLSSLLHPNNIKVHTIVPRSKEETTRVTTSINRDFKEYQIDLCDRRPLLLFAPSSMYYLRASGLDERMERMKAVCENQGYRMIIATGPRTGNFDECRINKILGQFAEAAYFWERHSEYECNPYLYYLDKADVVVTTGDSLSMMSDAVNAGKKVLILPDQKKSLKYVSGYCKKMMEHLRKNELARFYDESIDMKRMAPADTTKTGWDKVENRLVEIATRRKKQAQLMTQTP